MARAALGLVAAAMLCVGCPAAHQPSGATPPGEEPMTPIDLPPEEAARQLHLLGSEHGDYVQAVRWFESQGPAAAPFLLEAFEQEPPGSLRRVRIVEAVGAVGGPGAVPLLAAGLSHEDLRWASAQALGRVGGLEAERALLDGLAGGPEVAKDCLRALALLPSPAAADALRGHLAHSDGSLRYYAAQALAQSRPEGWRGTLSAHLATEPDADVRRLIETALAAP